MMHARNTRTAYLCLIPGLALVTLFIGIPIVSTFLTAFSSVSRFGIIERFGSIENLRRCLVEDPVFWSSLVNTIYWTAGVVMLTIVISLPTSLILNQHFPAAGLVRAVLILPWAASLMVNALVWRLILDNHGSLNLLLKQLHLTHDNVLWRSRPSLIFFAMILVGVLVSIPFTTTVFLAGLQSIPHEVHEAAAVDGARPLLLFGRITLPLLRPVFVVVALINIISVFNSFPIVWTISGGDPVDRTHLLITYLFKLAFGDYADPGKAAAIGVITFVLLLAFSIAYTRSQWRTIEYA